MRKPNWKRRGLPGPITEKMRKEALNKRILEQKIRSLPIELQDFVKKNPEMTKCLWR